MKKKKSNVNISHYYKNVLFMYVDNHFYYYLKKKFLYIILYNI